MKAFGKTIRLFLLEGSTNSLITAELSNWTGIALKVPRIKVKDYSNRPEFQKPGVYILLGKDESEKDKDAAYIGEAEKIGERLIRQLSDKEFWNEVVFFTSKDKYLNKASIRYLENRMHELAGRAGRYKTDQNVPTRSELSEAEQAELEEFLSNIKLLTSTLGHKIFEEIEETLEYNADEQIIFHCKNATGIHATGTPSTEGFVVFKGSLVLAKHHSSLPESIRSEKEKMVADGLLRLNGDALELTKPYTFNSSSRAAAMVLGRSSRGPTEWNTEGGQELREFEIR
jgi:hypothetical protein